MARRVSRHGMKAFQPLAVVLAVAVPVVTPELRGTAGTPGAAEPACALFRPGADRISTSECLRCHPSGGLGSHPVDISYDDAQRRSQGSLRPTGEVVRRGIFLSGGMLSCLTCHDSRSPWKYRIALPPGAQVRPAADPDRRETYESDRDLRQAASTLPPGSAVATTPLCTACHTIGD